MIYHAVLYRPAYLKPTDPPEYYNCYAEDRAAAIADCLESFPDSEIVHVSLDPQNDGTLEKYYYGLVSYNFALIDHDDNLYMGTSLDDPDPRIDREFWEAFLTGNYTMKYCGFEIAEG